MKLITILLIILFIVSCGQSRKTENYSFKTQAELTLTEESHPHGYGERDCFYCHIKGNIHQHDTLGTNLVDVARRQVEENGINSCSTCHGDNGVTP